MVRSLKFIEADEIFDEAGVLAKRPNPATVIALTASLIMFGIQAIVLLLLLTFFRDKIAMQSARAMGFRVVVRVVILVLLWLSRWRSAVNYPTRYRALEPESTTAPSGGQLLLSGPRGSERVSLQGNPFHF